MSIDEDVKIPDEMVEEQHSPFIHPPSRLELIASVVCGLWRPLGSSVTIGLKVVGGMIGR